MSCNTCRAKWLVATLAIAFALLAALHSADNYFVLRLPSACSSAADSAQCADAFRVVRRQLGIFPKPSRVVTRVLVKKLTAQLNALRNVALEIKQNNVVKHRWTDVAATDCEKQMNVALYHLGKASTALEDSTHADDIPYWISAARRQISNCLDGFGDFAPDALSTPAGVFLNSLASQSRSAVDAVISAVTAAAGAVRGRKALESHVAMGDSDSHPDWVESGVYEQIKELQAHMQGGHDAASTWGERRQLKSKSSDSSKSGSSSSSSSKSSSSSSSSKSSGGKLRASVVVGTGGDFKKIKDALKAAPKSGGSFVIYVKEGVYKEKLSIDKEGVMLIGDGMGKTIITGKDSVAGGSSTYGSATVTVNSDRFLAAGITFENAAGPEGEQAVALMISGDRAAVYESAITGYQDTLCVDAGRQFYSQCYISGYTDFIFGDAAALIDRARIYVRAGKKYAQITASGRESNTPTGIVIRASRVTSEPGVRMAYLGRPWKDYARVVYVDTYLPKEILPDGWSTWNGKKAKKAFYAEKGSTGPGASSERASWAKPGVISDVRKFGPQEFIGLSSWLDAKTKKLK